MTRTIFQANCRQITIELEQCTYCTLQDHIAALDPVKMRFLHRLVHLHFQDALDAAKTVGQERKWNASAEDRASESQLLVRTLQHYKITSHQLRTTSYLAVSPEILYLQGLIYPVVLSR